MRILQISHINHIRGGSDAVYFATKRLLEQAGHEVISFCMDSVANEPSRWSGYFASGVDTQNGGARGAGRYFFNPQARRNLARLLDDIGSVDVAHLHIYHGKQTPAILPVLRRRGIPVVHSLHEYKLACPTYTLQRHGQNCEKCITGSTLNGILHRCKDGSALRSAVMVAEFWTARMLGDVRLVDRFLCVSEFQRQLMGRAGLPSEKLHLLHNFVDTDGDEPAPDHGGYLLYFGRLEKLKGLPTLIEAVAKTGQRLVIAGEGDWRGAMQERIWDLPNVEYAGFQSGAKLQHLIRRAKAVVVPSEWYENCPMSVLEAMAQGRPVVDARIGGIPELVTDGKTGFLFEPGNVDDLVRALNAIDSADQAALSSFARRDAEKRFSARHYLTALLRHYHSVQGAMSIQTPSHWTVAGRPQ
ncbi:MAG: glycosyltransferase family 4 protein [Paracoccaceae bacterium]